jgi:hypothetical protein
MHEEQLRMMQLRQLGDVRKHRPIGRTVVERNEDLFIHERAERIFESVAGDLKLKLQAQPDLV